MAPNDPFHDQFDGHGSGKAEVESAGSRSEIQRVRDESHASRLAALNLMEDAIVSREAWRRSEERLQGLIKNLPGGAAFVVDRDLRYLLAEGEALTSAGFKPENFVGKTISEALSGELPAQFEPNYRRALAGQPFEQEHDAHGRSFITRGIPLRGADGAVESVLAVSYDITERKRVEAALRLSEQRLQRVLETEAVGVIFFDRTGTMIDANEVFLHLTGYTRSEIQERGLHWYRLTPPEFMRESELQMQLLLAHGKIGPYEKEYFLKDGSRRWMLFAGRDLGDGTIVEYVIDIHARKRAEAELAKSEAKYRTLFDSIDEGFCVLELISDENDRVVDYRFLEVNRVFERQTGLADVVGKLGSEVSPNTENYWAEIYEEVARTGEPRRIENYSQSTDRWYSAYASRIGGAGSRQVCIVFADITRRKQQEWQQTFLVRLSDVLSQKSATVQVQAAVAEMTMDYLGADRCYYCEFEAGRAIIRRDAARGDLPSIVGVYPLADFPIFKAMMDSGVPIVVEDSNTTDSMDAELKRLCVQAKIISFINVPVLKQNRVVGNFCITSSAPRKWKSFEVELAEDIAERIWTASERTRAEELLRESEAKYRMLFESIDEGFCILELLWDDKGNAVDWIYTLANPAFEKQTGFVNPLGKRISDFQPDLERSWFDRFAQVARTGEAVRFAQYTEAMNVWFDVYAAPVGPAGDNRISLLFRDITARKRQEANDALLARIAEDLGRLMTPNEIINAVGERIGEALNLNLCLFVDVDEERDQVTGHHAWQRQGSPSLEQTYRISDFLTEEFARSQRTGETFVVRDAVNDERTQAEACASLAVASILAVPFHRDGRWVASVTVTDSVPRDWRADEIAVVRQVAERVFSRIERARAEEASRESEERFRAFVTASNDVVYRMNADWSEMHALVGKEFIPNTHDPSSTWLERYIHPEDQSQVLAAIREAIRAKMPFDLEHRVVRVDGTLGWTHSRAIPLLNEAGEVTGWFGTARDTTDRRRAEDALRESEARYRAMFEQAHVGVVRFSIDGRFLEVNPGACAFGGYSEEELLSMRVEDVCYPEDFPRERELTTKLIAGEIADYSLEKRYVRKDGSVVWGNMTATLVKNAAGEPLYVLAIVEAIGERKRAEEELRVSEERFRQFAENSADVFWIVNARTRRLEYLNPIYEQMWGETRDAIMRDPKHWLSIVHPDDRVHAAKAMPATLRGKMSTIQYRIIRPSDGEMRWMRDTGFPIRNEAGEICRVAGVIQDITEDKERSEALRESEERFRLVVEGAPEYAMFLLDTSNHIIYWSHGAEHVFGWSSDEALGQSGELIFTPEDRAAEQEEKEMATAREQGSAPDRRWHLRKDGSRIWVDGVMHRLDDENGELRGYAKIARDASEQREAEAALQRAHDELEERVSRRTSELQTMNDTLEAEMERRQMLEREILQVTERERVRISQDLHDSLCQELTATAFLLKSSAKSFAANDPEAAEALEDAAETVNENAGRARDLARGLHPFELSGGLPSALRELCARYQEKIACICDAPRSLRLDPNLAVNLYRIAQEAVTNVAKHAQANELRICLAREGSHIVLRIQDNGKKAGKVKPGMGIHMMQYRANAIGGGLEIESARGRGTTATCRVPLKKK